MDSQTSEPILVYCRDCKGEGENAGHRCGTCLGWGTVSTKKAALIGWEPDYVEHNRVQA